ncbi:hypothetical protein [Paenibacillus apiarius]|uniref:hypothetical protein n=1 Tax=Paenibacillus apiarius TaxID=46240 RepID=UPI003B3ABA91
MSSKYRSHTASYNDVVARAYELIGGAKPSGYGKVRINIKNVQLEKNECDFDSLMLAPTKHSLDRMAYIEAFIDAMDQMKGAHGTSYFDKVHFDSYVSSKLEKQLVGGHGEGTEQNPKQVNWDSIIDEIAKEQTGGKGGGYPKTWRLKSPPNL